MMGKFTSLWMVLAILLLGSFFLIPLKSQGISLASTYGQEMREDKCPLCGQPWQERAEQEIVIPKKLPTPKNQLWISKLREALSMTKLAKAQDEANQKKFGISNPYLHIIPQMDHHIALISKLFSAYGLPARGEASPIKTSATIVKALEGGKGLATNLVTQYEWLLGHAEDKDAKRVLNFILTQTKLHVVIFDNVIRMLKIQRTIHIHSL